MTPEELVVALLEQNERLVEMLAAVRDDLKALRQRFLYDPMDLDEAVDYVDTHWDRAHEDRDYWERHR